jgi:hypothetical protein
MRRPYKGESGFGKARPGEFILFFERPIPRGRQRRPVPGVRWHVLTTEGVRV